MTTRTHALILCFDDPPPILQTALNNLITTLRGQMTWTVTGRYLPLINTRAHFDHFVTSLLASPADKLIVYYVGYAMPNPEGEYGSWYWHDHPDGNRCWKHLPKFSPQAGLRRLCLETDRDVLVILHCPATLETSGMVTPPPSSTRPNRQIAVWHFNHSPTRLLSQTVGKNETCKTKQIRNFVLAPNENAAATFWLSATMAHWRQQELDDYRAAMKGGRSVPQFVEMKKQELEDLKVLKVGGAPPPKSEIWKVLGDGFVVERG